MKKTKKRKQPVKKSKSLKKQKFSLKWWLIAFLGVVSFIFLSWDTNLEKRKTGIRPDIKSDRGALRVPGTEYSFGEVSLKNGKVTQKIPLLNLGEGDLILFYLETSCGCTSARVINKGSTSPFFGMTSHGKK